mgnify:CR=1 FL=1
MKGIHVFPDESGKLVRVISRQCNVRLPKHAKCFEILNIGGTGDGEGGTKAKVHRKYLKSFECGGGLPYP